MIDEGYVKFESIWTPGPAPACIEELVAVRNALWQMGLIGVYEDSGIGYGNVSQRQSTMGHIAISGTSTGQVSIASGDHFCTVTRYDLAGNKVWCTGPVGASSETMTHAMLYECAPWANAVVHVHNKRLWDRLLWKIPTSAVEVAYGTPAMALEMQRLLQETDLASTRVLAMGGHEEGIIALGSNPRDAMAKMMEKVGDAG